MPLEELLRIGTPRPIVRWGDPVLHTPARPVTDFDDELQRLIADMFATNTAAPGAGLAAAQIGVDRENARMTAAAIFQTDQGRSPCTRPDWPLTTKR